MYSMSSYVFLSSTSLRISFGYVRRINCAGVNVSCALFTEAIMAYWVGELFCHVWLLVLWAGESTSSSILLRWVASWGEHLSRTWWAAVGGVTTLGTCSSPRRQLFQHALSFECTSKLCGTFLNNFLVFFSYITVKYFWKKICTQHNSMTKLCYAFF